MANRLPRVLTRVGIYLVIIALAIAWQYWPRSNGSEEPDAQSEPSATAAGPAAEPSPMATPSRLATGDEWNAPIAELGRQRLAKQQPWIGVNGWDAVGGELVWWHDGFSSRIAYLPAPGEIPEQAGPALFIAIQNRQVVLFGDAEFAKNLGEWAPTYQLPPKWTVLLPPGSPQP